MNQRTNSHGQPIGEPVDFQPARLPEQKTLRGQYCHLEPFDLDRHVSGLFKAYQTDTTGENWTYLPNGPYQLEADFRDWAAKSCTQSDPFFYTVIDPKTNNPLGVASFLRINPAAGSIEVGWINFSPLMQQSRAATEAMYLMMQQAFGLGYRRYEWKCDSLNAPSRKAAVRLGFQCEGLFRQAVTYKGRNRDTAWYAIIDKDWPAQKQRFETWLKPENFDSEGLQISPLNKL